MLNHSGKLIGVELTEFVVSNKARENFEFKRSIVNGAKAYYKKLVAEEIKGSIHIFLKHDISLNNSPLSKEKLSQNIAHLVINEFNNVEAKQESSYAKLIEYGLEDFIYGIELHLSTGFSHLIWWEPSELFRSGEVSDFRVLQKIKNFIDLRKEKKVNAYLEHCDECWLLVIAIRGNYSPIAIPNGDLSETEKLAKELFDSSGFSKIFLFNSSRIASLK